MAESGRAHPLARPVMFVLWALVFWGTLTAISIAWRAIEVGPGDALRLLLFGTPNVSPALGRFSLACALVAVATWATVLGMLLRGRRSGGES